MEASPGDKITQIIKFKEVKLESRNEKLEFTQDLKVIHNNWHKQD